MVLSFLFNLQSGPLMGPWRIFIACPDMVWSEKMVCPKIWCGFLVSPHFTPMGGFSIKNACRTSIFGWLNDVKRWNQPFPHEFWLKPTLVAIKPRTTPDIQGIRVAVFGVHRRNWSLLRCARGGPRNYRTLWGAAVQARAARCRLWCGCPTKIRAL